MAHKRYGVISWEPSGRYLLSKVVKEYDREVAAQRYADGLNDDPVAFRKTVEGYVVRETAYMLDNIGTSGWTGAVWPSVPRK